MKQYQNLTKQAIELAKLGKWAEAAEVNQQILQDKPEDVLTLNRLGFCYLQVSKKSAAQKIYQQVLTIEKLNPIARKYLELIRQNIKITNQGNKTFDDFVEEPRKTKIVGLDRLAGSKVLRSLSVASRCTLKPKGRYVCVATEDGEYIGSLPEDISVHLSQLIKTGNKYLCLIKSVTKSECHVFIRELEVTEENRRIPSFLIQHRSSNGILDADDDVLLPDLLEVDGIVGEKAEDEAEEEEELEETLAEPLPPDIVGSVMREE